MNRSTVVVRLDDRVTILREQTDATGRTTLTVVTFDPDEWSGFLAQVAALDTGPS